MVWKKKTVLGFKFQAATKGREMFMVISKTFGLAVVLIFSFSVAKAGINNEAGSEPLAQAIISESLWAEAKWRSEYVQIEGVYYERCTVL